MLVSVVVVLAVPGLMELGNFVYTAAAVHPITKVSIAPLCRLPVAKAKPVRNSLQLFAQTLPRWLGARRCCKFASVLAVSEDWLD